MGGRGDNGRCMALGGGGGADREEREEKAAKGEEAKEGRRKEVSQYEICAQY